MYLTEKEIRYIGKYLFIWDWIEESDQEYKLVPLNMYIHLKISSSLKEIK